MAKSQHKLESKVYNYGCRIQGEALELLLDRRRKSTDYRRKLVAMEREHRDRIREIRRKEYPDYAACVTAEEEAEQRLDAAYEERNRERQRTRKRSVPEELDDAIGEEKQGLRQAHDATIKAHKQIVKAHAPANEERKKRTEKRCGPGTGPQRRAEIRDMVTTEMTMERKWPRSWKVEMEEHAKAHSEHIRLRMASGLGKPMYDLADEEFAQACEKVNKEGGRVSFPKGISGRVGLELKPRSGDVPYPIVAADGYTVQDDRITIEPLPFDPNSNADPNSKRSKRVRRCAVRIVLAKPPDRSGPKRKLLKPAMLEFTATIHRPLPAGARIKRVWVKATYLNGRWTHELQLTVQSESFDRAKAKRHDKVQVTLCSAPREDGGILAATWSGSDGSDGEIVVDERTVDALWSLDDNLQGAIDQHHNQAREMLVEWSKGAFGKVKVTTRVHGEPTTQALQKALKGCGNWRTPGRLCGVVRSLVASELDQKVTDRIWKRWKETRLESGLDLHASWEIAEPDLRKQSKLLRLKLSDDHLHIVWLEWWRRKNEHLRKLRENQRVTAQRRRITAGGQDYDGASGYRVVAKQLAGRYQSCEIIDYSGTLKRRSRKQSGRGILDKVTTRRRRIAGGSILTDALKNAFGSENTKRVERAEEVAAE